MGWYFLVLFKKAKEIVQILESDLGLILIMSHFVMYPFSTLETSPGIRCLISKMIEQFLGSLGMNLVAAWTMSSSWVCQTQLMSVNETPSPSVASLCTDCWSPWSEPGGLPVLLPCQVCLPGVTSWPSLRNCSVLTHPILVEWRANGGWFSSKAISGKIGNLGFSFPTPTGGLWWPLPGKVDLMLLTDGLSAPLVPMAVSMSQGKDLFLVGRLVCHSRIYTL